MAIRDAQNVKYIRICAVLGFLFQFFAFVIPNWITDRASPDFANNRGIMYWKMDLVASAEEYYDRTSGGFWQSGYAEASDYWCCAIEETSEKFQAVFGCMCAVAAVFGSGACVKFAFGPISKYKHLMQTGMMSSIGAGLAALVPFTKPFGCLGDNTDTVEHTETCSIYDEVSLGPGIFLMIFSIVPLMFITTLAQKMGRHRNANRNGIPAQVMPAQQPQQSPQPQMLAPPQPQAFALQPQPPQMFAPPQPQPFAAQPAPHQPHAVAYTGMAAPPSYGPNAVVSPPSPSYSLPGAPAAAAGGFCGGCGQAKNGAMFCSSCGAKS